tara:strand:- start:113 stop:607 length:495 start_codon:yes stop_codon:yes gene_type:complete
MAKRSKPPFDLSKISDENLDEDEREQVRKQARKELLKAAGPGSKLKDFDIDDRKYNRGRPKNIKKVPPRGSGKYMSQFEKDMNKAKKEGNVKEQKRLERVKKSVEANIKKFGDKSKDVKKPGPKGPRMGVMTGRRAKNVPTSILKRMNMGGVMKGRGGTFKGSF